ncbi:hypothetical protein KDL01_30715, partial [Actinospica durhamensis]
MSGEYRNGAPDGWFGGADGADGGQAPTPEANAWRAASADDVTTQMPKVGGNGYGDGYGNGSGYGAGGDGAYGAANSYGPGPAAAPVPAQP